MENQKNKEIIVRDYTFDYVNRMVYDSIQLLKHKSPCYVYTKQGMELVCSELDKQGIPYTVEKEEDYWIIKSPFKKGKKN